MIKGVVFDLDHTLFDRYATLRAVLPEMYKRLRDKIPENVSLDEFIEGLIKCEKKHIYLGWDYTAKRLIEEGVFLNNVKGSDIWQCLFKHCWPLAAVKFPFTEPMLVKLRESGYKLGIITNGEHTYQSLKIEMLGIAPFVDEIIICGDIKTQKPSVVPFEEMSKRLNLPSGELMYVGDNPLNDVDAARKAGYTPVWVRTVGNWCFDDIERCEYEVDTVEEIPDLVEKINKKR